MPPEKEYVLGTHDEEIERLGLQHRIWHSYAADAWQRAGFGIGQILLDVGCGPGWATLDLAGVAGPQGRVIGIDVSRRFLEAARGRARSNGCDNVELMELDLEAEPLPPLRVDGVWSRWVYAFLRDPRALLARVSEVLKPGGTMVLHEYVDYRSWRLSPERPEFTWFVEQVIASWRERGGEPDVGLAIPGWLAELGFEIRELRLLQVAARPGEPFSQWPDAFVGVGIDRLVALGRMDRERAESVRRAYRESQSAPGAFQITPNVLEVIAVKR